MKRKLMCSLLCGLIVFGSFAFAVAAERVDPQDVDWGITLYVDNITPTGLTLITNQMGGTFDGEVEYDSCYTLQVLKNEEWTQVPALVYSECNLDSDTAMPNSSYRSELNWEQNYGVLPSGHYRFVREFFNENKETDMYVEFAITESHSCSSGDQDLRCDRCYGLVQHRCADRIGDAMCDICGKRVSDQNVYRVVGGTDWMGRLSPSSNRGIMKEVKSGIYEVSFKNVPAGEYAFMITINGEWEDSFGANGNEYYQFSLEQAADLTVTLDIRNDIPLVSVSGPDPLLVNVPGYQNVYRVTGNADWMGNWDPANDEGVMRKISPRVYRKIFRNVPPGEYELKITKDGQWEGTNSSTDGNYCFVIRETQNIAVDFYWNDDTYVIDVREAWPSWLTDEDTENPPTADLSVSLPAILLLLCAAAVPLLLRKRKEML